MNIFVFNTAWMIFNLYLAVLPVIFSKFLFKMPHKIYTVIAGALWFLYLPNTIYVFSDLHHLVEQWSTVDSVGKVILVIQYGVLEVIGLTCFLVAFYPVEKILQNNNFTEKNITRVVIVLNILIGFAIVLGKIERVNSWDIFVNPIFVVASTIHMLSSYQLIGLSILFGLFTNFFYFLFRDKARKLYSSSDITPPL